MSFKRRKLDLSHQLHFAMNGGKINALDQWQCRVETRLHQSMTRVVEILGPNEELSLVFRSASRKQSYMGVYKYVPAVNLWRRCVSTLSGSLFDFPRLPAILNVAESMYTWQAYHCFQKHTALGRDLPTELLQQVEECLFYQIEKKKTSHESQQTME